MTISYTKEVASSKGFGIFWKLLFRWKGSVYKMIWRDLVVFTVFYLILSMIYRFALTGEQREVFKQVVLYCKAFDASTITFVLGFYVSLVVTRWWGQFETLPWPYTLAILVSTYIKGTDRKTRLMRRTIVRYANVSFCLTARMISPTIEKVRFPSLNELVDEGFLMEEEKVLLEEANKETGGCAYWLPLIWANTLLDKARTEGYIKTELGIKRLVEEICSFRAKCGGLIAYDWISIPLVYTQVVTIAVYSYLYANILGQQFLEEKGVLDIYVPILTYIQLIFYVGWLKVAESLVNPFGKDDEDFDVDALIDSNLRHSYLIIDKSLDSHPTLREDKLWDQIFHRDGSVIENQENEETKLLRAMEAGDKTPEED